MNVRASVLAAGVLLAAGCHKDETATPTPNRVPDGSNTHSQVRQNVRPKPAPVATPRPRPAQLTQVTIKALGMYCEESCPMKVRIALAAVPAVYELGFDVSTESIFVSYDATLGMPKDVTKPMLVAIRSAGFDPWLAKESWPADAANSVHVMTTMN